MGSLKRVRTASGSDRAKRKALKGRKTIAQGNALGNERQKRPARGLDARAKLHSDLGKKVWAVITHPDGVTGNLTHDAAMKLAQKTGGYVTTREAILRCD